MEQEIEAQNNKVTEIPEKNYIKPIFFIQTIIMLLVFLTPIIFLKIQYNFLHYVAYEVATFFLLGLFNLFLQIKTTKKNQEIKTLVHSIYIFNLCILFSVILAAGLFIWEGYIAKGNGIIFMFFVFPILTFFYFIVSLLYLIIIPRKYFKIQKQNN